ncbi:glycosyltransferase [Planktomarina temperata]|nr:glycosyltransferase [Planktomarina temperata]
MKKYKVSVIMPNYNNERFIKAAIDSVIRQTYDNFELIIVDDHSIDNSTEIIDAYDDKRIKKVFVDKNVGVAEARAIGMKQMSGTFLIFIDSDDYWMQDTLRQLVAFSVATDATLAYAGYYMVDEAGQVLQEHSVSLTADRYSILRRCDLSCLVTIVNCSKINIPIMNSDFKREDLCFWLDILKQVPYAYGLQRPLGFYRLHSAQSSISKMQMARANWRIMRVKLRMSYFWSLIYILVYGINGVNKYFIQSAKRKVMEKL